MEILRRGNTAEVKKVKDGIVVLEVKKKIRYTDTVTDEYDEDKDEDVIKSNVKKIDDGDFDCNTEI
jgi:hypothetical protein